MKILIAEIKSNKDDLEVMRSDLDDHTICDMEEAICD